MATGRFRITGKGMNLLCSNCDNIIKTEKEFDEDDWKGLTGENIKSVYCENCDGIKEEEVLEEKQNFDSDILKKLVPLMEDDKFKTNLFMDISEKLLKNIKNDGDN
jgi:hypothetical protein